MSENSCSETANCRTTWLWFGFGNTAGIQEVAPNQRYSVWKETHQDLKRNDSAYAAGQRFFGLQLCLAISYGLAVFWMLIQIIDPSWAIAMTAIGTFCASAWVLVREQRRRNHWIGLRLRDLR